jgi:hypothetical protein
VIREKLQTTIKKSAIKMLVKYTPVVYLTKILRAAFVPTLF